MSFAHYICIAVTSISHLSQQRRQQQQDEHRTQKQMELEKEAVAEMQDSPNPGKNAGGV